MPGQGTEDGYQAIRKALVLYGDVSPQGLHLVLFTDEDRDELDAAESKRRILDDVVRNGTALDVVVNVRFRGPDGRAAAGMDAVGLGYVIEEDALDICLDAKAVSGSVRSRKSLTPPP